MSRSSARVRLAVVAAAYAVALAIYLRAVPRGATRPAFVFVAMVSILGLMSVLVPVVPVRVPAFLRPIRGWEKRGRLYRALGVAAYGTMLRRTPLRLLNPQVYVKPGERDHGRVTAQLEAAEASHLVSAVLTAPYMVYAGVQGSWGTVVAFLVAQALVNLYPIAHTRMARGRMERIARRYDRAG